MTATNVNICVGDELGAKAQSVLTNLGLDVPTAVNMFLTQVVDKEAIPFEMDGAQPIRKKIPLSELRGVFKGKMSMADDFEAPMFDGSFEPDPTKVPKPGCLRGQIWMADDFDAPLKEFEAYM